MRYSFLLSIFFIQARNLANNRIGCVVVGLYALFSWLQMTYDPIVVVSTRDFDSFQPSRDPGSIPGTTSVVLLLTFCQLRYLFVLVVAPPSTRGLGHVVETGASESLLFFLSTSPVKVWAGIARRLEGSNTSRLQT